MPALFIDSCSQLKSILEKSESLPPHYWLVSYLECYDTSGWDGCDKWGKSSFILTDEELKKDIAVQKALELIKTSAVIEEPEAKAEKAETAKKPAAKKTTAKADDAEKKPAAKKTTTKKATTKKTEE